MNPTAQEKSEGVNPLGAQGLASKIKTIYYPGQTLWGSPVSPKAPYGSWKYALRLYLLQNFIDDQIFPLLVFILALFKKKKPIPSDPRRLLFIRFSGLGDAICALPALQRFKEQFPSARLTVLCIPRNREAFRQPFVDEIVSLDRMALLARLPFLLLTRFKRYDLCLDTEKDFKLAAILSFFLSQRAIGFSYEPGGALYDATVPHDRSLHGVLNLARLLEPLGIRFTPESLVPLSSTPEEKNEIDLLFKKNGIRTGRDLLIGIHAFAAPTSAWRAWPVDRVAELIGRLQTTYPSCKIILTGLHSDSTKTNEVLSLLQRTEGVSDFSNVCTGGLFYLIRQYKLLVTIDSGPMHVAAAQGVKVFALFGPKPPSMTGPYPPGNHYTFHHRPPSCDHKNPEDIWSCHCRDEYIRQITVDEVMEKITGYLG